MSSASFRAGWARGSQFVFSQHCKAARSVGLPEEKIANIPNWQVADCYTPVERALLAYTDALVFDGGRVADGVFDALKAHLSDEEILEFTYVTALYDFHAVISRRCGWNMTTFRIVSSKSRRRADRAMTSCEWWIADGGVRLRRPDTRL